MMTIRPSLYINENEKWKRLILRHNNIAFLTITEVIPLHEKH